MLDVALKFVTSELNGYLLSRTGADFGAAQLRRLVDDTGKCVLDIDHLGLAIVNLEEERTFKPQLPETTYLAGQNVVLEPKLLLHLHVLVVANFTNYEEALRYLSRVLTFFQAHPTFTPDQYPGLDPRIEKLVVELQTLSYEQLNQMWAFVGGKQLPSAVYRIKLVALQDTTPLAIEPPIMRITTLVHA